MFKKYILPSFSAVVLVSGIAWGAANSVIRESVAVCDPNSPTHCAAPDSSGNLPVTGGASVSASATAKGGTITVGGTSQTAIASNSSRKAFIVQNPCTATEQGLATAEDLYINLTSAATVSTSANLAVLAPCAGFSLGLGVGIVSPENVTIIAATTSHIFYAKEW